MSRLRACALLAAFAGLTLPLMPVQQLFVWFWPSMARNFPMHYHRLLALILGVKVTVTGVPAKGPALLIANHVGWLDIVVLSQIAPLSFIAKREVKSWPFFGVLARLQRTVFVDRNRRRATGDARDDLRQRLRAGERLVLFAEGTSSDGRRVLPFKSSLLGAAEDGGTKVQPVTLAYYGHRNLFMNRRLMAHYAWYGAMELVPHLWQALAMGPIEVTVICHPPLALEGEPDRKALAKHGEEAVRRGLVSALHGRGEIR